MLVLNDNIPFEGSKIKEIGKKQYYHPYNWNIIGLNIIDQYDNGDNTWLEMENKEGEWCVACSWLPQDSNKENNIQKYSDCDDIYHYENKVGEGIYRKILKIIKLKIKYIKLF